VLLDALYSGEVGEEVGMNVMVEAVQEKGGVLK
jgi:hypothetical protein